MILEILINYKNIVLYKIDLKLFSKLFFNNIWHLDYEKRNRLVAIALANLSFSSSNHQSTDLSNLEKINVVFLNWAFFV